MLMPAGLVDEAPSASVTRIVTTTKDGPVNPAALNVGPAPVSLPRAAAPPVSPKVPSPSRSHVKLMLSTGSVPVPESTTVEPSATVYGPPALAVGGTLVTVIWAVLKVEPPSSSETRNVTVAVESPFKVAALNT